MIRDLNNSEPRWSESCRVKTSPRTRAFVGGQESAGRPACIRPGPENPGGRRVGLHPACPLPSRFEGASARARRESASRWARRTDCQAAGLPRCREMRQALAYGSILISTRQSREAARSSSGRVAVKGGRTRGFVLRLGLELGSLERHTLASRPPTPPFTRTALLSL